MRYKQYLIETDITYEQFCLAVDGICLNEAIDIKNLGISNSIVTFIQQAKSTFEKVSVELKASFSDLIKAFKTKQFFEIAKAFGFSFKIMVSSFVDLTSLIRKGLFAVLEQFTKSGYYDQIKRGVIKIDELLDKFPILKKLTGPPMAALLFYMWLNMSFIGDFDFDFDMTYIKDAFMGRYTIHDLFASPDGLLNLILTFTGSHISVSWLMRGAPQNFAVAIMYTIAKNVAKIEVDRPNIAWGNT